MDESQRGIMVWKSVHCLPCTIGPTDIIPLINWIFHKSYGGVSSNLKAIADCGWNPPNRKLMEHKELIDDSVAPIVDETETPSNAVTTYMHAESSITLNIHNKMAGTVLDCIITERARSSQTKKQQMRERGKVIQSCKI